MKETLKDRITMSLGAAIGVGIGLAICLGPIYAGYKADQMLKEEQNKLTQSCNRLNEACDKANQTYTEIIKVGKNNCDILEAHIKRLDQITQEAEISNKEYEQWFKKCITQDPFKSKTNYSTTSNNANR